MSLGIPLVAVNTLEIEAEPYRSMGMPVCAVLDAGRSEVSAAMYADEDGQWRNVQEARVLSTEELCSEIDSTTFFCGEALPLVAEALQASLGDKAVLADQTPPTRSPGPWRAWAMSGSPKVSWPTYPHWSPSTSGSRPSRSRDVPLSCRHLNQSLHRRQP